MAVRQDLALGNDVDKMEVNNNHNIPCTSGTRCGSRSTYRFNSSVRALENTCGANPDVWQVSYHELSVTLLYVSCAVQREAICC